MYCCCLPFCRGRALGLHCPGLGVGEVTLSKLECSKQALAVNILAWYEDKSFPIGLIGNTFLNRDSWGHSYLFVRGEILGFFKDELMRKHLPRMFSLIKNES